MLQDWVERGEHHLVVPLERIRFALENEASSPLDDPLPTEIWESFRCAGPAPAIIGAYETACYWWPVACPARDRSRWVAGEARLVIHSELLGTDITRYRAARLGRAEFYGNRRRLRG